MKIYFRNIYTKAFYLLTNEICSKYVISVKFSICESKKVAVQPYSGDELCSAISWKDMESGIDTIQCKISCSHIFERISIALLKVKSILWALSVGLHCPSKSILKVYEKYIMSSVSGALFTITAMCAKDTHAHSCHSRVVLHFARPWYPVIRQDFKILWV